MRKYFNTEGVCIPEKHYMVPLDDRIRQIREKYVDPGKYFIINRGRQYGKTTTLRLLARYLKQEYLVVSMDFQGIGTEEFRNETMFSRAFAKLFSRAVKVSDMESGNEVYEVLAPLITEASTISLMDLFERLSQICETLSKPIVVMIDEIDSAANNQVFLDFLAQLRGCYLDRDNTPIFHSVILAGVYDIKNLKLKLRPEAEHKYNSPWNTRENNEENGSLLTFDECSRDHRKKTSYDIAAEFKVNMNFPAAQIETMLEEYELEHHTGADMRGVAEKIYQYTSGYPYLVSAICKRMDEDLLEEWGKEALRSIWTKEGVSHAVDLLLKENPPLFDSMARQLDRYPDLKAVLEDILFCGKWIIFSLGEKSINLGMMFG